MKVTGGQRLTQRLGAGAKQIRRSLLRAIDAHCAEQSQKPVAPAHGAS